MAERNVRLLVAQRLTEASLALSLCASVLGCTATPRAAAPVHEHWVPAYVFGIWGKSELDMRDDCPAGGAARVRIGATLSLIHISEPTRPY